MIMTSASSVELSARLDELDAAIEAQKQVLKDLSRARKDVLRQLNGVLDPLARLPLEISSEIFIHCLLSDEPYPDSSVAPLLLLNICAAWTEIALSTPALWAKLAFEFTSEPLATEVFSKWIARAGGHQLSLSLGGDADGRVGDVLAQHSQQLWRLDVTGAVYRGLFLKTAVFQSLETAWIRDIFGYYSPFSVTESLKIFQSAPNLTKCTMNLGVEDTVPAGAPSQIEVVHATLRSLKIGGEGSALLLQYLTFPALQHLDIELQEIPIHKILPFLARSTPPLQSLRLDAGNGSWTRQAIEDCLRHMPTLTDLTLMGKFDSQDSNEFQDTVIDILVVMAPDAFLPNLTTLTVLTGWFRVEQFTALAAMLRIRRTSPRVAQLQSFRLDELRDPSGWYVAVLNPPDLHARRSLRALVADGMEVYIGHEDDNYLKIGIEDGLQ